MQGGVEDLLEGLLVEEDPPFVGPHLEVNVGQTTDGRGRGPTPVVAVRIQVVLVMTVVLVHMAAVLRGVMVVQTGASTGRNFDPSRHGKKGAAPAMAVEG